MESLELTVILKRNGVPVAGFPFIRRTEVNELQAFNYSKAADNDSTTFSALPADQLAIIQVLAVRTSQPVTLRLDGQTDAGIVLNAGGLLLLVDATIDAGAGASNAKVNNPHATVPSVVEGIAGGT